MSPLNHKRTTISLAPPIFYAVKKWQLKDRRLPISTLEIPKFELHLIFSYFLICLLFQSSLEAWTTEDWNLAKLSTIHHPRQPQRQLRQSGFGRRGRKLHGQPQQGGRHVGCCCQSPSTTTAATTTDESSSNATTTTGIYLPRVSELPLSKKLGCLLTFKNMFLIVIGSRFFGTGGPRYMQEIGTPKIGLHIMNLNIKRPRIAVNLRIGSRKTAISQSHIRKIADKKAHIARAAWSVI